MRWCVYKIERRQGVSHALPLGYVNAPHQPAALAAAWKRWPKQLDDSKRQRGLSVITYGNDRMSLGRAAKAARYTTQPAAEARQ
jgi:hypothetical protein